MDDNLIDASHFARIDKTSIQVYKKPKWGGFISVESQNIYKHTLFIP